MSRIVRIQTALFETPLHHPFVTSQGRSATARGVAVLLTTDDGIEARGESVPAQYVTGETRESVLQTVERIRPELIGIDVTRYRIAFETIARLAPESPSARCGLEMAVLHAWAQATQIGLWQLWGGATTTAETDITIPIVPEAASLAMRAWQRGIRTFKIKVGSPDVEEDCARVQDVLRAAPHARIRLDANQAFTPENALRFVERLIVAGAQIELLEQPVAKEDLTGLHFVATRSPVPVFADESCRTPQEALRLVTETGVHGFNCKINKSGIAGVLEILPIARAAGRRLMLGCMLETRYSIAVSLALACGTGAFEFIDLDSHLLLDEPGDNPCFHQQGATMRMRVPPAHNGAQQSALC
ncbi:MAG: dipeptide epimerase [Chloroherpetonaceae bacterium]|nr:dipeptide epimerase [Chthonomonadaceae bacterium]MDW8206916.1 dipeptide epimerase [Chloroherpetonaceae bacterium]